MILCQKYALSKVLEVETFDSKDALSHFRTLQLLPKPDLDNLTVAIKGRPSLQSIAQSTKLMADADQQMAAVVSADNQGPTAPPLLRTMSLFCYVVLRLILIGTVRPHPVGQ